MYPTYNNIHLSILKNELTDLLVYSVPKLFHIHKVLGTNDVLKERVRAKGTVKELVVTVVARVERFAALGIKISEGKVKLPVMILCRVSESVNCSCRNGTDTLIVRVHTEAF